jgi:hypothetical protein
MENTATAMPVARIMANQPGEQTAKADLLYIKI